jgi:hypothetical protein
LLTLRLDRLARRTEQRAAAVMRPVAPAPTGTAPD